MKNEINLGRILESTPQELIIYSINHYKNKEWFDRILKNTTDTNTYEFLLDFSMNFYSETQEKEQINPAELISARTSVFRIAERLENRINTEKLRMNLVDYATDLIDDMNV